MRSPLHTPCSEASCAWGRAGVAPGFSRPLGKAQLTCVLLSRGWGLGLAPLVLDRAGGPQRS